jgi:hypothetical protein
MDRPSLETFVDKWKTRLRVADWQLTASYAHQHQFSSVGAEAQCNWQSQLKRAQLLVLEPDEYHDEQGFPQDIEESVVHELLHLHFAAIDDTTGLKGTVFEQAIECIATALVALDRR